MKKLRDYYRTAENAILIAMMIISTLIVCYSVFMRYIIDSPVIWSEELVCYLQVWIAFVGISYVARNQDDFIRFDFVLHRMKPKTKAIINVIERGILLVFMCVLTISSAQWLFSVYGYGGVSTPMKVPNWIPRMIIPVSFFALFIHYVESLVEEIQKCRSVIKKGE